MVSVRFLEEQSFKLIVIPLGTPRHRHFTETVVFVDQCCLGLTIDLTDFADI